MSHRQRFGEFVDEFTLTSDKGFARFADAGLVRWLDPAG
jgi:hypothetical protein